MSGLLEEFSQLQHHPLRVGIWGLKSGLDHRLNDRDRIEIYRELRVDPKVARRERFNRQGSKSAGLFAKNPARRKSRLLTGLALHLFLAVAVGNALQTFGSLARSLSSMNSRSPLALMTLSRVPD